MTITFLNTLMKDFQKPEEGKTYKCEACYRPNLKSDFVALVSRGEAYCNACIKGASNEYR
jgi:hypothetical protein